MTLVVSKIINGKFINISDSQIMEYVFKPNLQPNPESFNGVVKTVIIHSRLCISYAGNVFYANKVLKEILELHDFTLCEINILLLRSNCESNHQTIYLAAYIAKNERIQQSMITQGQVVDFTDRLIFLGDPKAYKVFENKLNELKASGDKKEEDCMKEAFDNVIKDKTVESVDHFKIVVTNQDGPNKVADTFEYNIHFESHSTKPVTVKFKKAGEYVDIPMNPSNEGFKGTSMFVSRINTMFGFAIYDLEKESGVLFCPQLKIGIEHFKIIKGKTIKATYKKFLDTIYEKYKLPLEGFVWLDDSFGIQYISTFPKHLKK